MSGVTLKVHGNHAVAGEAMTGEVVVTVAQPTMCQSIMLQLSGQEATTIRAWDQDKQMMENNMNNMIHQATNDYSKNVHMDNHSYFSEQMPIINTSISLGSVNGGVLQPGTHTFPINWVLPAELPSTFFCEAHHEIKMANVQYFIVAGIANNGMITAIQTSQELVVYERPQGGLRPIELNLSKEVGVFSKGFLKCEARAVKNSYSSNEQMDLEVKMDNQTKKDVRKIKIRIERVVTARAQGKSVHRKDKIQKLQFEGCPKHSSRSEMCKIPLSTLGRAVSSSGRIVTCLYRVHLELDVAWGGDLKTDIQFTVTPPSTYNPQVMPQGQPMPGQPGPQGQYPSQQQYQGQPQPVPQGQYAPQQQYQGQQQPAAHGQPMPHGQYPPQQLHQGPPQPMPHGQHVQKMPAGYGVDGRPVQASAPMPAPQYQSNA